LTFLFPNDRTGTHLAGVQGFCQITMSNLRRVATTCLYRNFLGWKPCSTTCAVSST